MEYCAEIAVFQSACILAERSYPGGLKEFSRYSHNAEYAHQIVCHSVAEITQGLLADLSCSQAEHWNLMLTVMSTWRTISYVPKLNAVLPADDLVADFIQPLPEWNFSFFYDLIKHNNWIKYFLQVIDATRKTAGLLLIQLILDELNRDTLDASDIQIVITILEYFAIIENKYASCLSTRNDAGDNVIGDNAPGNPAAVSPSFRIQSSGDATRMFSATQDISVMIKDGQRNLRILMYDDNFVTGVGDTGMKTGSKNIWTVGVEDETKLEEVDAEEDAIINVLRKYFEIALSIDLSKLTRIVDSSRLLVTVLNLASFIVGGSVAVFRNHCLFESYSLCPRYSEPDLRKVKVASRPLTDDEFDHLIALDIVECPLLYIKSPGFSDSLHNEFLRGIQKIIMAFSECLLPVRNYLCQTSGAIDVAGVLVIHPVLRLECYRRIFLNAFGCLVTCVDEPEIEGLRNSLQFLSDLCMSRVSQCVQGLDSRKDDRLLDFERALVLIEHDFVGGKEHYEWLIESDCIEIMKDPRWLKCLEDHWENFPVWNSSAVHNLLLGLRKLKLDQSEEYLNRLQQLILKVYGCLSLDERTKVLTSLYGGSQPSPFDVDSDDFARQLLNAQSKLMTSDALQIKDREVVSEFLLLVLQRPLETIDRLILIAVKNKQHVDVVAEMLLQLPILTELENANGQLVVFETISHWLWMAETFKDEEQNAIALCRHLLKSSLNLHLTQKFLECCILAHSGHLVMKIDSAANLLYADLTLELILVTCESLAIHRKRGRPPEVNIGKPEALLDSHCVVPLMAWLCQVIDGCGNLWISWNKYCLQKTFLKEKAVTALNSLLETAVSCDDEIPGVQVQWLLQRLSRLHWTIPHYLRPLFNSCSGNLPLSFPEPLAKVLQRPNDKPTVLGLPELVVLFKFCRISDDTLEVALNCLALPDLTNDCRNFYRKVAISVARVLLSSILPEWFRIGRMLKRLLCDYFLQRKIHMVNDLAVCKVFVDAVLLIKEGVSEYSDEKFLSIWQHLTNAFAAYFKNALQTVDQSHAAKVGIGLVIRFLCIVPKSVTQPLDILIADLISGTRTDPVAIAEIRSAFVEVDEVVDMATSKAILDQIVM